MLAAKRRISVGYRAHRALFHASAPSLVKTGDSLPDLEVLNEDTPGTKINLAREITGKGLIIGVPAAFSTYTLNTTSMQTKCLSNSSGLPGARSSLQHWSTASNVPSLLGHGHVLPTDHTLPLQKHAWQSLCFQWDPMSS